MPKAILPSHNGAAKAVLYLRMSSDQQETSIGQQRNELLAYATKQGYTVIREYADEGISGDATEKRRQFLKMREDCCRREFSVILCWDQDRFGRFDILEAGHWIMPFRSAGVRLETIAQGPIDWTDLVGQLIYSVNQLGKAQYLRDLSRNTTRGMIAAAKADPLSVGGIPPFGFKRVGGKMHIKPQQAEIVRSIYRRYLAAGGSLRGVALWLNKEGIPTRGNGKRWSVNSLVEVLRNRKYMGDSAWGVSAEGRYHGVANGEMIPRRKTDKPTRSQGIIHEGVFPVIIPKRQWDAVQRKLAGNKTQTAPRTATPYVLSGLCRCGQCSGPMVGRVESGHKHYQCRAYHEHGKAGCQRNTLREALLVDAIVRKIRDRYSHPQAIDRLKAAIRAELGQNKPKRSNVARIKRELQKLDAKIDKAEDAVIEAPASIRPGLYTKLESLKFERDRLSAQLASTAAPQRHGTDPTDAILTKAIEALQRLPEAFSMAKPEARRELMRSVVSRIELHFDHSRRPSFDRGIVWLRPGGEVPQLSPCGEGWGGGCIAKRYHCREQRGFAREQRNHPTEAEKRLW